MSAPAKKNMAASVRQRLLNLSKKQGVAFDLMLVRFAIERLLYRLSCSEHADAFLLKGAMLFAVWSPQWHRPTRDVDLLGFGPKELEDVESVFKKLCDQSVLDDGLAFQGSTVHATLIRKDAKYGGVRVDMNVLLGNARIPLQVDIGYGDAITPGPDVIIFPSLLGLDSPKLRAYPVYTVVAEKFEALVSLGATNSRMKDFFDLRFLSQNFEFQADVLEQAIRATFERRGTPIPDSDSIVGLSDAFARDRAPVWNAFLNRNGLGESDLSATVQGLRLFLLPILPGRRQAHLLKWKAGIGWQS